MKLSEFINKYLNTKVDYDKAYGFQCVDLFRQYCHDVLKTPHTGSVNGAKDLFLNYDELPTEKKFFSKLESNAKPYYGDVVIWDKTVTNEYGHVAIFITRTSFDEILVLEQDGFKQDGVKLKIRNDDNILGFLRYIGTEGEI